MKIKDELSQNDIRHLEHCLSLAEEAFKAGDAPFGSILVDADNEVIATARNRINELTALAHPELELAQWAAENLSTAERKRTTMYTSGEHCPMCAAAHGWAGLGTIVYLSSAKQLGEWLGNVSMPIRFVPAEEIVPDIIIKGPASGPILESIKNLQLEYHGGRFPDAT
ncbi:nucleoside deaminase [Pricia sp. S334]|uniref:Nucleoside deaminase n=1 Tax=Pricia mediterranea TaxID=3076079 RepID=A0ABU3L293_9FLAO|nr:nucleoside deaminase [Pricia sp. S334]MDT7827518.1 nucleoside deaminase [Pricia sp. S334]